MVRSEIPMTMYNAPVAPIAAAAPQRQRPSPMRDLAYAGGSFASSTTTSVRAVPVSPAYSHDPYNSCVFAESPGSDYEPSCTPHKTSAFGYGLPTPTMAPLPYHAPMQGHAQPSPQSHSRRSASPHSSLGAGPAPSPFAQQLTALRGGRVPPLSASQLSTGCMGPRRDSPSVSSFEMTLQPPSPTSVSTSAARRHSIPSFSTSPQDSVPSSPAPHYARTFSSGNNSASAPAPLAQKYPQLRDAAPLPPPATLYNRQTTQQFIDPCNTSSDESYYPRHQQQPQPQVQQYQQPPRAQPQSQSPPPQQLLMQQHHLTGSFSMRSAPSSNGASRAHSNNASMVGAPPSVAAPQDARGNHLAVPNGNGQQGYASSPSTGSNVSLSSATSGKSRSSKASKASSRTSKGSRKSRAERFGMPEGTLYPELNGKLGFTPYPAEDFALPEDAKIPTEGDDLVRVFVGQLPYFVTDTQLAWLCYMFGAQNSLLYVERITKRRANDRRGVRRPTGCVHAYCSRRGAQELAQGMHKRLLVDDTGVWLARDEAEIEFLAAFIADLKANPAKRRPNRPSDSVVMQYATSTYIPTEVQHTPQLTNAVSVLECGDVEVIET